MSTVEEATRCIKELNGIVTILVIRLLLLEILTSAIEGSPQPPDSRGLLGDGSPSSIDSWRIYGPSAFRRPTSLRSLS